MTARDFLRAGALLSVVLAFAPLVDRPFAARAETDAEKEAEKQSALRELRLKPLAGEEIRLADRLAKGPVVLDFWATWCKPCVVSLPEIQKLHEKYSPRGLSVIGVSLDGPRNAAKVRPFVAQLGLTFSNVLDEKGELQRAFQVQALPTTILVSPEGEIVSVRLGFRPGEEKSLAKEIEKYLPAAADSAQSLDPTERES